MRIRDMGSERQLDEVVIIDDDQDVCEALVSFVAADGYRPTSFRTGQDALQHVREVLPALILVDATMPDFDGWQFLEAFGRIPCADTVQVILMSADTRLDEARARALGACGILRKPFDVAKLSRVIQAAGGSRGQMVTLEA